MLSKQAEDGNTGAKAYPLTLKLFKIPLIQRVQVRIMAKLAGILPKFC